MTDLVERLRRRAEAMDALGSSDLSDAARATTAWQIESAATLFHAANDSVEAAAEISRLQKEVETARENAFEEAAKVAYDYDGKLLHYPPGETAKVYYEGGVNDTSLNIAAAIRTLKDKEVAG